MSPAVMRRLAKPMLFAAALIWGTSFFIMKNTLDALPVFYLLATRFTAGAVLLGVVFWKKWKLLTRDYFRNGAIIGGFLFLGERLSFVQLAGGALILLSVLLDSLLSSREKQGWQADIFLL